MKSDPLGWEAARTERRKAFDFSFGSFVHAIAQIVYNCIFRTTV